MGSVDGVGAQDDPTLTRTAFGDAWAAQHDRSESPRRSDETWPPGPGRFGLLFYPLTRQPYFSVLALTGPAVSEIRQGGWNLARGFGSGDPNPVTDVEMRSSLVGGGQVGVQSAWPERFGFPAVQLSDYSVYPVVAGVVGPSSWRCSGSARRR